MDLSVFYCLLILIGVATGVLTGLTGASGMSILISGLLLAGLEIREVIALTFVVTLANSFVALPVYWKNNNIDKRTAVALAVPAALIVPIGHLIGGSINHTLLTSAMLCGLFYLGLKFIFSRRPKGSGAKPVGSEIAPRTSWLICLGSFLGLVMGVMGGGGSVFIAAGLIILFKTPVHRAVGTSIFVMGFTAISGSLLHITSGTLNPSMAAVVLLASVPTSVAASRLANRFSETRIQKLLGIYLLGITAVLAFRLYY